MFPSRGVWAVSSFTIAACAVACGMASSDGSTLAPPGSGSSGTGGSTSGGWNPTSGSDGSASGSGGSGVDPLPPEQEVDSSFEVPVATGRYVWIANPLSGRVAYVDASTLKVQTVEAGNAPTYLAPIPGNADAVVVLNVASHDATVLRASTTTPQFQSAMVARVAPLANAWAVSPDGRFALAWTDARQALRAAPRTGTLEGFQDITVIDLMAQPPAATTVAVGYRPVSVTFSADGTRAFAVTEDGVSVVGLPGPTGAVEVIRDVPLTNNPSENADTRDVSVTADGRAVVRREGSREVRIVDLASGATGIVSFSAAVTDLDITPDGTHAVAVLRQASQVAVLPLATAVSEPSSVLLTTLTGELVGSVTLTADGKQAILYSNATDAERIIVLDMATANYRVVRVHAPVLSVTPTPDGRFALVLHHQPIGSGVVPAAAVDGGASSADGGTAADAAAPADAAPASVAAAFSVVPLDGSRSGRIQETKAQPRSIAIAPDSSQAIVTVRDDRTKTFGAYLVGMPALQVTTLALASPPIATGVVAAANRGYVAQSHPEGRITFIPFATGIPQTLTGFDLGARVVDGVTP